MILGIIINLAVGLLCVVMGLLIWLKQKVSLLHDYHYKNVKEEDMLSYCKYIGIGIIVIGLGICATGILDIFESSMWWLGLVVGFVAGFAILNHTQKKYNGKWID